MQHGLTNENYSEIRIEIVVVSLKYYSEINFDGKNKITNDLRKIGIPCRLRGFERRNPEAALTF